MDCIEGADLSSQESLCGVDFRTADHEILLRTAFSNDAYGTHRVCIASICKLFYWNKARYSHDLTYEIWPVTICTQTIQCMSIASFCFLYLKPLFEILDSGFIRSDELRRKGQLKTEGSYNLSNINSRKERRKEGNRLASLVRPENNDTNNIALEEESEWDGGSQNSEAHIINET